MGEWGNLRYTENHGEGTEKHGEFLQRVTKYISIFAAK